MTEQNTLTTENEVERIVEEFKDYHAGLLSGRLSPLYIDEKLRQTITPLIEDRNARAREMVEKDRETYSCYEGCNCRSRILKALSHGIDL
jgi:hypothetical protein